MNIELVDHTDDAEYKIGMMAGECYNARRDKDSCISRAIKCFSDGHLATLRFAYATFHVDGISRICSHQFVRSKHLDFLQQSQRYVDQKSAGIVYPPNLTQEQRRLIDQHHFKSQWLYEYLRNDGVKKEDARFVLPEATKTSLYVTGNLQAWRDFLRLRADKHAQWEIREVAEEIGNLLATQVAPNLFKQYLHENISN